jgi:hypothetical protein
MVSPKLASILPVSPRSNLPLDERIQNPGRHRRSEMKKYLTIAALLTVIATPAFAQEFNPGWGTGNVLPFAYKTTTQNPRSAANASGARAFAMAPAANVRTDRYSPAINGGGSEGYNWTNAHDF